MLAEGMQKPDGTGHVAGARAAGYPGQSASEAMGGGVPWVFVEISILHTVI